MTIPPELAALQRYAEFLSGTGAIEDDLWFGDSHHELKGMFWWRAGFKKCVDDVARAWPQRASGEVVAWRWVGENLSEGWWTGMPSVTDMSLAKRKGWTIEYAYSHPADTSALLERIAKLEADNLELREISCKNYSGAMLVTNERDACMKTIAEQRDYIHSREELIEEYANEMLNLIAATARVKKKFIKTLWCLATEKGGEISFSYSTFIAMRDDAAIEEFQSDDKNKFVFRASTLLAGEGT